MADPSSGFVKPEWTTDSGNQSADGRMDPPDSVDYVHMYLRKWAHFIVYFIESGLLVLAMKNVMKAWKAACAVFGLCTILAIADEAHKVLIVGRHCQWDEAGINIVGVIMGVLLTWSILWLIRWARGTLED